MSNKAVVLERANPSVGLDDQFSTAPASPDLPEDDVEDGFDNEPNDDLLHLYDCSIGDTETTFTGRVAEEAVVALSDTGRATSRADAVSSLLTGDADSPRNDESLQ